MTELRICVDVGDVDRAVAFYRDGCCKASSADKCPTDVQSLDEASCGNYLDMVKQEMAASKKALPAACAP